MIMSSRPVLLLLAICILYAASVVGGQAIVGVQVQSTTTALPSTSDNKTSPSSTTPSPLHPSILPSVPAAVTPPKFPENVFNWNVTDKNNILCIQFYGAIQLTFTHNTTDNKTKTVTLDVQKDTGTVSGTCGDNSTTQTMNVVLQSEKDNHTYIGNIVFTFWKINSTKLVVELRTVDADITMKNATVQEKPLELKLKFNITEFSTPVNSSFKCNATSTFSGTENSNLKLANLKYEAFHIGNSTTWKFGEENVCTGDHFAGGMGGGMVAFLVIAIIALIIVLAGGVFYFYRKNTVNAYENM